jgi:plasmid stability protein
VATVTVRSFDDEDYEALKAAARVHGTSMEAEARSILSRAVHPFRNRPRTLADLAFALPDVTVAFERSSDLARDAALE